MQYSIIFNLQGLVINASYYSELLSLVRVSLLFFHLLRNEVSAVEENILFYNTIPFVLTEWTGMDQ
jgi:hypothetical protein